MNPAGSDCPLSSEAQLEKEQLLKWLNKEERTKKQFKDFLNHSRRSKTQPYGSTQQEKIKNQNALLRKLLEEKSITNDQTKALVERRLKITRSTPQNLPTAPKEVNDRA
ncbi:MAG: hypothetical protein AAFY41_17745, partial [Bacteroidota bacterium]